MSDILKQEFDFIDLDDNSTLKLSVADILSKINANKSKYWVPYDEFTWIDGMCEHTNYGVIFMKNQKFKSNHNSTIETIKLDSEMVCYENPFITTTNTMLHGRIFYPIP